MVSLVLPLVKLPSFFGQFTPWYDTLASTLTPIMLPEQTLGVTMLEEVTITGEKVLPLFPQLSWLGWIYLIGASIFAVKLLISIIKIRLFIQRSRVRYKNGYYEVLTEGKLPTFSFFNYMFWDNNVKLSPEEERQVRQHELAHIKGLHSVDLLFVEIMKIIFWFNPAIYLTHKALVDQHEFIADRTVLHHTEFKTYARFVVQSIFQNTSLRVVHNFNQSQLKTRIAMMKKNKTSKKLALKAFLVLPFVAILILTFSCEDGYIAEENQGAEPILSFENKLDFESEVVLEKVDLNATPKEGFKSLFNRLISDIKIPKGVEGKVYIEFIIGEDGKLRNAIVRKGVDANLDQQVLANFVKVASTNWNPGTKNEIPVAQKMILPIAIKNEFDSPDSEEEALQSTEYEVEVYKNDIDKPSMPKEGIQALMQKLAEKITYPESAKEEGIEGTVYIQFVVNTQGQVQDAKIVRGVTPECDKVALETFTSLDMEWVPAEKDGKPVNNQMVLPVKFKIN